MEHFSTEVRYSGFALGYNAGAGLLGGVTPLGSYLGALGCLPRKSLGGDRYCCVYSRAVGKHEESCGSSESVDLNQPSAIDLSARPYEQTQSYHRPATAHS
jgi:hypothetical protein